MLDDTIAKKALKENVPYPLDILLNDFAIRSFR